MSSTTNVQNLLTNVFRPTFVYDTTSNVYQTKLELANIDTISANVVTAYAGNIGDSAANVYVGVGAGNSYTTLAASSNTSDTFVGTGAGGSTSNVKNSVFLGYRAGFGSIGSSNSISIGANTLNGGNSNIYIGCATGIASGSNNIFLGPGVSNGGSPTSNTLLVGSGNNVAIVGDLAGKRVGINLSSLPATTPSIALDVSGYARVGTSANGGLGINKLPGAYALDVNGEMQVSDGYGVMTCTHDSAGISRTTLTGIVNPAGVPPAVGVATLQVSDGYFSANGTVTGLAGDNSTTLIGYYKKGMTMISVQNTADGNHYLSRMVMVCQVGSTYTLYTVTSNQSNLNISNSGGGGNQITLVNTTLGGSAANFTYSITYFPMP